MAKKRTKTPVNTKQTKPASGALERLYGHHSVKAVLRARPHDVTKIYLAGQEDYHKDLIALAHQRNIDVFLVPWPDFMKLGRFDSADKHQGIFALVQPRTIYTEHDFDRLAKARCVLMLDQVTNPQNLATIIRSAAFFRADAVCFMKNRAATPTPEVARFAVGGAEFIDFYRITNVANSLDKLKQIGFTVLGLDERGQASLADHDMKRQLVFVTGAEGEGLRQKTKHHCDELVTIPGGRKGLESLNAGVATTIALYEWGRLRPAK